MRPGAALRSVIDKVTAKVTTKVTAKAMDDAKLEDCPMALSEQNFHASAHAPRNAGRCVRGRLG